MIRTAIFALCLAVAGASWAQDTEDYEAKLRELKKLISELQTQLDQVNSTKDSLSKELSDSETEIGQLNKKIKQIEGELDQEKKRLALLHEQRAQLQANQSQQSKAVAEQLVSAYKLGNQNQLKALLNLDDSNQLARILRYHKYIVDARQDKINAYLATVRELNQVEPAILAASDKLSAQQADLRSRQDQLQQANSKRKLTLAKLTSESKSAGKELERAIAERAQLQKLLDEVSQMVADIPTPDDQQPIAALKGKLAWPVQGKIKQNFGASRAGGKLQWDGILIAAPAGTPVRSLHGGRVVYSDWLRGQGLLLIIDHGAGYLSLYGHNETLYKEVGDWVKSGEVIGLAGTSGGQDQAGLYFEIRYKGQPQNPKSWCRG